MRHVKQLGGAMLAGAACVLAAKYDYLFIEGLAGIASFALFMDWGLYDGETD